MRKLIYICPIGVLVVLLVALSNDGLAAGRSKVSINSGWRFFKGNIPAAEIPNIPDSAWEQVNLPHSWNSADAFDDEDGYYQGIGWYSKALFLPLSYSDKRIYLLFEGANIVTSVYINGNFVGRHSGGYSAFRFEITGLVKFGFSNQLFVQVDNSGSADIPPLSADFTFYGGIYRDVFLEITEPIHFDMNNYASDGIFVDQYISGQNATVTARGELVNDSRNAETVRLKLIIREADGKVIYNSTSRPVRVFPGQPIPFKQTVELQNIRFWSPKDPYLYSLTIQLMDQNRPRVFDSIDLPLGFRTFRFDPALGFFLNGEHLLLMGANRHQDFEGMANALADELHYQDIKLLKEMGANFIRISHYPQDPAVLEACDRLGLVVWEEIPLVNQIGRSSAFANQSETMLVEMIRQHYNHPSVVMWGLMNEILLRAIQSGQEIFPGIVDSTTKLTRKLAARAHAEDPHRLTVIAHHGDYQRYQQANLLNVTDICGWNLYFGWYTEGFDKFLDFVDTFHKDYPDMPIIISEYGAGSDERIHSHNPKRFDFSTEWQQHFHEQYLAMIRSRPYLAGAAIWNLVDFGSEGRKDTKPHINQKGLLYRDRKPKDVYYFYQANLIDHQPVVKIACSDWTLRGGIATSLTDRIVETIKIYSNCQQVELRHDDISLGIQIPDSLKRCYFEVPFHHGNNHLVCTGTFKDGKKVVDVLNISYQLVPMTIQTPEFRELNVNVGAPFYYVEERHGLVWLPDQPYQKGSWGHIGGQALQMWPGKRWGTDREILGSDREPLYQTQRDSMKAYRFDVPDGVYQLELYFAEIAGELRNQLAGSSPKLQREFDVSINSRMFITGLNIAQDYGINRAVSFKIQITVNNGSGIEIIFLSQKGSPVVNAIRLRKLV